MHYIDAIEMAVFMYVHNGGYNRLVRHHLGLAKDYSNMLGYCSRNVVFDFNCKVAELQKEREMQKRLKWEFVKMPFFRWLKGKVFLK